MIASCGASTTVASGLCKRLRKSSMGWKLEGSLTAIAESCGVSTGIILNFFKYAMETTWVKSILMLSVGKSGR